MRKALFQVFLFAALAGCKPANAPVEQERNMPVVMDQSQNALSGMSPQDLGAFQWMNPPESFTLSGHTLQVTSGKATDFFNNPEDGTVAANAPFLYREIAGDFVATALVKPDFAAMWNAGALLMHIDTAHWIKFAFENSDATGKSIVSVVTRGVSDDANGVVLSDQEAVWLRMIRKGDNYALHWSTDGVDYKMTRLSAMPPAATVKIGLEAQCPVGAPAMHSFLYFSVEQKTVRDLRKGE